MRNRQSRKKNPPTNMTAIEAKKKIQEILDVTQDGDIRAKSLAALQHLIVTPDGDPWPVAAQGDDVNEVWATSFADSADVAAFRHCKALGGSDQNCFKVGDNGVGKWGDDCTAGSGPKCALPPEDWKPKWGAHARHAKVLVTIGDKRVVCEMDDTMPHRENIDNGAGIDLNPDACEALGVRPPLRALATWQWV